MKNLFALLCLAVPIVAASSCSKVACKDIDCGPRGKCKYGECICDPNYELDGAGSCTDTIYCANMDCVNGTCNEFENGCFCDPNFELDANGKCTVRNRDKFLGNWTGTHLTTAGNTVGPYTMTFAAGTADDRQVSINNLANYPCPSGGGTLEAFAGTNNETIIGFLQPLCSDYTALSGTFTLLDATHFAMDVTVFQTSGSMRCTGTFVKQ